MNTWTVGQDQNLGEKAPFKSHMKKKKNVEKEKGILREITEEKGVEKTKAFKHTCGSE